MPKDFLQYLPILLVVALIGFRLLRASQARKVRPGRLWIGPVYVLVGMVAMFALLPSPLANPFAVPIFAGAALIGAGVGYLRGKHQEFSIDPETGKVLGRRRREAPPNEVIRFLFSFLRNEIRFGVRLAGREHLLNSRPDQFAVLSLKELQGIHSCNLAGRVAGDLFQVPIPTDERLAGLIDQVKDPWQAVDDRI